MINMAKYMQQKLVYFEKTGDNTYKAGVEVACRWDDIVEEVQVGGGEKIVSRSFLLTPFKLKEGSIVWQGTLAQYKAQPYYPKVPTTTQGGYQVMVAGSNPSIRGQPLVYTARL